MMEISKFRLIDGTPVEEFLERNAEYQQHFIYQQKGLLRRTLASGIDGEWLAITWWRVMEDARLPASQVSTSEAATAFYSLLDPVTIETQYFKELPG
jgi:hypothetical protein